MIAFLHLFHLQGVWALLPRSERFITILNVIRIMNPKGSRIKPTSYGTCGLIPSGPGWVGERRCIYHTRYHIIGARFDRPSERIYCICTSHSRTAHKASLLLRRSTSLFCHTCEEPRHPQASPKFCSTIDTERNGRVVAAPIQVSPCDVLRRNILAELDNKTTIRPGRVE
jgi:hypothetical protein